MSRSNRLLILAIGGLIACLSVGVAYSQTQPKPVLERNQVTNQGKSEGAPRSADDANREQKPSPDYSPALQRIESAIRDLIPTPDEQKSQRQEQREVGDLNAQQDMALWAMLVFFASSATVVVTLVGLELIRRTLFHTRRAADYAKDMVEEARLTTKAAEATNAIAGHTTRVELRAYLSVLPAGINEMIGNQRAMGHVDVKNVGKLPARNVVVQVRMRTDDRESTTNERAEVFPVAADYKTSIDRAILPGTAMRQGAAKNDTIPVAELLVQKDRYVYVWGIVYYDDGYHRRFTRFRHRYAIASLRRDDWNRPARETRAIITVDKARFDPYGNSAN